MGMFDGLKFWKKKDAGFGSSPTFGAGSEAAVPSDWGAPQQPFQSFQPSQQSFQPIQPQMESFQGYKSYNESRDTELVLAKLDSIKAMLDNINQRLLNLERAAYGEQYSQPSQPQYGHNAEQRRRTW